MEISEYAGIICAGRITELHNVVVYEDGVKIL